MGSDDADKIAKSLSYERTRRRYQACLASDVDKAYFEEKLGGWRWLFALVGIPANKMRWNDRLVLSIHSAVDAMTSMDALWKLNEFVKIAGKM